MFGIGTTQGELPEAVPVLERHELEPGLEPFASVSALGPVIVRQFAVEPAWVNGPDEAIVTVPCQCCRIPTWYGWRQIAVNVMSPWLEQC